MQKKRFNLGVKSFAVLFLLLGGLFFGNSLQAQSFAKLTANVNWIPADLAKTELNREIATLDANLQNPPGGQTFAFLKSKHWYFREILAGLENQEPVATSVENAWALVGGLARPDALNRVLTQKEGDDLFQAAITLLSR